MGVEILKPFGPSVAKVKIPSEIIFSMNEFVEEIIKDKKKSEDLNYGSNLAGNVHQEFKLDVEFMKKNSWAEFLGKACQEWLKNGHNISVKKFDIISSWIVRQFKNEYNPIHYHGGHISGVGYLKVPKDMGQTIQKNKNVQQNGKLVLIDGSKKFLCNPTYVITPVVGDFYFFPSYMMHTVYPFSNTLEERRSVSFNAKIDDESAILR
tara:strand:- start:287 stop:910 length:624 start_codon:yes stop_codon:yes gene_type:complete